MIFTHTRHPITYNNMNEWIFRLSGDNPKIRKEKKKTEGWRGEEQITISFITDRYKINDDTNL